MNSKRAWYEEWFNTPYYHILYKDRDFQEAARFIDNLFEKLQMSDGNRVLDLACGKGRHSIYLNKLGLDVVGADLSEVNIREAKKFENERLHFKVHDMRKSIQADRYDFILNLFTSFGYFESDDENMQTLSSVYGGLKPGGEFIIDFLNTDKAIESLRLKELKKIDGIEFKVRRELKDGFIVKNISFEDAGKPLEYEEKVMAISKTTFEDYFASLNFKIIDCFGDYDLGPFVPNESDRLIYRVLKT